MRKIGRQIAGSEGAHAIVYAKGRPEMMGRLSSDSQPLSSAIDWRGRMMEGSGSSQRHWGRNALALIPKPGRLLVPRWPRYTTSQPRHLLPLSVPVSPPSCPLRPSPAPLPGRILGYLLRCASQCGNDSEHSPFCRLHKDKKAASPVLNSVCLRGHLTNQ